MPDQQVFNGEFRVAGQTTGTFTFTATANGLQGFGLMTLNGTVQVTIAASVADHAINGTMTGYTGMTDFLGSFSHESAANGTFAFKDPEDNDVAGTWVASAPDM